MSSPEPVIFQADGSEYIADACVAYEAAMETGIIRGGAWSRGQYPGSRLENNILKGIRAIGCWDIDRDQDWYVKPHFNEGIEITMVLNGSASFETAGHTSTLTRGKMALTSPWQKHSLGEPYVSASRLVFVILDVGVRRPNSAWVWPDWILASEKERKQLAQQILRNRHPVLPASSEAVFAVEQIFEILLTGTMEKDATSAAVYLNLLLKSLTEVLQSRPNTEQATDEKHMTIKVFAEGLARNLSHEWRLEDMARQCAMSRSQFSVLFKEVTNKSPIEYLNDLRLEAAAEQLREPGPASITQIGFDLGFNSSQYFSRQFSEYFGMSPRSFRARHLEG